MEDKVGFGFRPTEDELVGYYLHNKILGNNWLVDEFINEVNICSFDPWNLRLQSKIKSRDPMWYFFSKHGNVDRRNRRTNSGFWKLTGDPVDVKDQWGIWRGVSGKIGHKRVLVFLRGKNSKGVKSDWVIHEYHYTLLPKDQRTYVISRLEYKGDDMNILSCNVTNEPTPSFLSNVANGSGSMVGQAVQDNSGYSNTFSDYSSMNQDQWFSDNLNMQHQVPYLDQYDDCQLEINWDSI